MQAIANTTTRGAQLASGYRYEVDSMDQTQWSSALARFSDSSIYQTWPYDIACHPKSTASRLVLKQGAVIVAAAQARIVKLPMVQRGIAYIRWGPIWRLARQAPNPDILRQVLCAVHNEYAVRRRLVVRILPRTVGENEDFVDTILQEEGYRLCDGQSVQRTIIMDLSASLDDLYAGLHQKWRNCLNSARKQSQQIVEGQGDELFERFSTVYSAMSGRKELDGEVDLAAVRRLQSQLSAHEKMTVILCTSGDECVAGAIVSTLGDVGLYLHGASDGAGLQNKSSYLVQWRAIELLKEQKCQKYDLNGATKELNQGTYRFKSRLAGKQGSEVKRMGLYEACSDPLSRFVVRLGLRSQGSWRTLRQRLRRSPVV